MTGTGRAEQGFDEKYQRDFNIFNPVNQYQPTNPLNPINAYDPANPFNPINRFDPDNPANPINQYNPNNPFNPVNRYRPENPLNPINEFNPNVPFAPLDGGGGMGKSQRTLFLFPRDRFHVGQEDVSKSGPGMPPAAFARRNAGD